MFSHAGRIGQISVDMVNKQSSIDDSNKKVKASCNLTLGFRV